jgi:AAA domain, putative AbiEii toxin, Type IV TA system
MSGSTNIIVKRGSEWHRWEPHIHAPGTILEDKYSESDAWERYLDALERASPMLRAIGVTDYCSIETYKRLKAAKDQGRLKDCDLLFPNVELRLDLGTKKGNQVNIHLLVSPEDPDHVVELERFLGRLKFRAFDDDFACTPAELIRLGRKHDPNASSDRDALAKGTNQFKVSREDLLDKYNAISWAKENILIAIAGGADGTSGVQEAADATIRQEAEKASQAIFASSSKQREFWLGRGVLSASQIRERYGSLKPCLWGSDAHELSRVAKPAEDRFCWIKGIPRFDTLRQACIDPTRAYIGDQAPSWTTPSQVIAEVHVSGADWAQTPNILLNPGFVAIIGARGSGKTALADMIAAGCDSYTESNERPSFLTRAREHLSGASVELKWLDGRSSEPCALEHPFNFAFDTFERARYLSQQFVEEICSIEGMPKLIAEIERVIFEAHSVPERDGAVNFEELLNLRASRFRDNRKREEFALADVSDQIGTELEKSRLLPGLKRQVEEKEKLLQRYNADKKALLPKGQSKHAERLQQVETAAEAVRRNLRYFVNLQTALTAVNDEVADFRTNTAPNSLRAMKTRNVSSGLKEPDWQPFLLTYSGDVDGVLRVKVAEAEKNASGWRGVKPTRAVTPAGAFVADDADLARQPLAVLEAEKERLQKIVAADTETQNRLSAVSRRIAEETTALETLREQLKDCEGARERAEALVVGRQNGYTRVFDAILSEEKVLNELYAPLVTQLTTAGGSLAKLSFSVTRIADHEAWAKKGEDLFDLRGGPFKGIGSLAKIAATALRPAWETGTAADVSASMTAFRDEYTEALLEQAPVPRTDQAGYRAWTRRFAQWLYSTDHIEIRYGIRYDGIEIQKLSPGTRGIVVLMLYLALDRDDVRPLIIDQPEENLDPKSIFDELVPMFEKAKRRRQVIMVTHNANLVVNADADQIIIANVGSHASEGLPPISYNGGGLEEADIRSQVCDILEGGQDAFKERARRLRVALNR